MLKASATICFAKMIYYGKNSCVSVGNYKEVKVAKWSLNVLICPLPPIVVAHCFGSPYCFQFSNNPLGLVPNPSTQKYSRNPCGLWWAKEKFYQEDMRY